MDAYDDDEWEDSNEEFETEEGGSQQSPSWQSPKFTPTYVLVALDTDASMFAVDDSGRSAFMNCLEACYKVTDSLVMADSTLVKGPLAIVLAENEAARANFIDFQNPLPDTVKLLKDLKNQTNKDLKAKYQRKADFDIAAFFLYCKNKLTEINAEVYKRIVLYITNDDNPVQDDPRKRFKVINESQKFESINVDLKVFSFKADFDSESFYSEVLSAAKSKPVDQINSANLSDKISTLVQKKHFKLKCKFYPFIEDTERYFKIMIYKNIQSPYIMKNMYVTRNTQKEVKKHVKPKEHTGNYFVRYSKKKQSLKINETEKEYFLETNLPIGYTLFYVGDEILKPGWVIESPVLMEKHGKEPQSLFEIFWEFCREKSKCLFCLQKFRKWKKVRVVQLVPKFINGVRMFLVKALPFMREVRYIPKPPQDISYNQKEENAMTALVEAMTFTFNPANFNDPVYSKRMAYIKSQLLNEPMEEIPDGAPTDEKLDELVINQAEELIRLHLVNEAEFQSHRPRKPRKPRKRQLLRAARERRKRLKIE